MSAVGSRLVGQFRQCYALSVVGKDIAYPCAVIDVSCWYAEDDAAGAFAVELLVGDDVHGRVGIKQLDSVDELQVSTVDGDEVIAVDFLAGLL